jgi:hypothetical protein
MGGAIAGWLPLANIQIRYADGRDRFVNTNLKYWNDGGNVDHYVDRALTEILVRMLKAEGVDSRVVTYILTVDAYNNSHAKEPQ